MTNAARPGKPTKAKPLDPPAALIDRLEAMKREALEQLTGAGEPPPGAGNDGDPSEVAEARRLDEIDDERHEAALQALREIDATLVRVRAGTYGRCATCGASIPRARLHAVPTTAHCAACQSTLESGSHGPAAGA